MVARLRLNLYPLQVMFFPEVCGRAQLDTNFHIRELHKGLAFEG
jgi:hypothetical protein